MTSRTRVGGLAAAMVLTLALLPLPAAQAQLQLPGGLGQGGGGGGGLLGGLGGGVPSVDQASPGNLAGVMQFCIKNNYLSGGGAQSVGSALLGKAGGAGASGFKSGSSGLLQTGGGKTFGLGGGGAGGLKGEVTHKVCDLVLQHAKSLL